MRHKVFTLGHFPKRLFSRLLLLQVVGFSIIIILIGSVFGRHFRLANFEQLTAAQLNNLNILKRRVPRADFLSRTSSNPSGRPFAYPSAFYESWCRDEAVGTSLRVSLVALDGVVLCDSHSTPDKMDNHLARQEIQDALRSGHVGHAIRRSETLGEDYFYSAQLMDNPDSLKGFLRVSQPMNQLEKLFSGVLPNLLRGSIGGLFLLLILMVWILWRFFSPFQRILSRAEGGLELETMADKAGVLKSQLLLKTEQLDGDYASDYFGEWNELEAAIEKILTRYKAQIELLEKERKEQSLLISAVNDAVLGLDLSLKPMFYNSKVSQVWPNLSERRHFWEFCNQPDLVQATRAALALSHDAGSLDLGQFKIESSSGTRWYEGTAAPIQATNLEVYGVILVIRDMSKQKQSEQVRVDFVANASHEMKTPITAIKGYVDTLILDLASGRAIERDFLLAISRNANRMGDLIQDLLDLSKLDGTQELTREHFSLKNMIEQVLVLIGPKLESKHQKIELEIVVEDFFGDRSKLEQVLFNLIDNASKYSPEYTKIGVRAQIKLSDQDAKLLLVVSDQGAGIPKEHQSRLFERFYRIDRGRSRELGGTGLGLAIVKHIVQLHGGRIWVESDGKNGSEFFCEFPILESSL